MSKILKFPEGFLWGATTSAHQVEGNNRNNWTEWEKENAERLSKESGGKYLPENYISGRTCDHYNRYEEDFDLAKSLGHNAHRFSIEWSRIEPEEGKFNEKEIEHYREVILALRARGVEPFITLWHWTMPVWFVRKGAFERRKNIAYFVRFCEAVVREFKNEVKFWIVLNEPNVYAGMSYFDGEWPPQKRSSISLLKIINNLAMAHITAFKAIHGIDQNALVGIAMSANYFQGWMASIIRWFWVFRFFNRIKNHQDFIGLNYYYRRLVKRFNFDVGRNLRSDMGWEIYPEGIYHVLKSLRKYKKPIYITENGISDAKDEKRTEFIKNHLYQIHKATSENIDVRGYFYWSLLDNFEWDKGFWPRFGLVEIDYKTLERKPRSSSRIYERIAKSNAIEIND